MFPWAQAPVADRPRPRLEPGAERGFGVLLGVFLLIGLGVFVIALGLRVKRGDRGARVTVSVIGVFISLFLWPVVFTVSAIVLQFLPSSNAWFESRQLP